MVATLAPGLVVFALPTVGLIAQNEEFFEGDYAAGRDLYVLGLLLVAFGFALWGASRWPVGRFLWTCYLLVTPGWFVYTALGDLSRSLAAAVVTLLIVAIAWMARQSGIGFIRGIEVVSVMLLLGVITTTLVDVRASLAEETEVAEVASENVVADGDSSLGDSTIGESEQEPNIYHIVMDEYQTEMFELTLDHDLEESLSGFVYYPEARATYGRTEMSMASTLGADDYDYQSSPQVYVENSLRGSDSSLIVLGDAGYRTAGYSHLTSLYGSPPPFDESILHGDVIEVQPAHHSSDLLNSLWLYSNTPGEVAERFLPEDDYSALAVENLLPDDAPAISAWSMERFIARERNLPASGRYSLIHLILPHFPYVLSDECDYMEGAETSPLEQTMCANNLVTSLIEELKRLDRFDQSVIVIHGDHGARFQRHGAELHQLAQDFEGEEWNDARSRSLLLIKPARIGANNSLVVSEYPALLTDIMPTVFDSAGLPYLPRDGRTSLLADTLPERTTRYYYFYDKAADGLPDGTLMRFVIDSDGLQYDRAITLPSPSADD